jgi:squalene-hopene/tetraprenyl-beta-curcumene cyclase
MSESISETRMGIASGRARAEETTHLDQAIWKAQEYLLAMQHPDGYWVADLEGDSTLTSDYILLSHFLGRLSATRKRKAAAGLLRAQLPDGGWNVYTGGPAEINATVKGYVALRLCGVAKDDDPCRRAAERAIALGGVNATNVFTKIYLAIFGLIDWDLLPSMPVEVMFLPRWCYFNIYELSYWTRTIIVPLFVIAAKKPVVSLGFHIDELFVGPLSKKDCISLSTEAPPLLKRAFIWADAALKLLERGSIKALRALAVRKAEAWIVEHHDKTRGLGAILPAMMNSIIAMKVLGRDEASDPMLAAAIQDFEDLVKDEGDYLWVQPCVSVIWDTGLALFALLESGMTPHDGRLRAAAEWLLARQVSQPGDWRNKCKAEPGGWAFQFENEFYPDVDDTALILNVLGRTLPAGHDDPDMERGLAWAVAMQGSDGGWGAFDRDNNKAILNNIPYADHGAVLDPSTSDLTGRMLDLLGGLGRRQGDPVVDAAVAFLKREQEHDGAWYGRWGVNYIYGTSLALQGLVAVNEPLDSEAVRRGVEWFKGHQNLDGGWGESCRSYESAAWRGRGTSTPSQTSWALLALMATGEVGSQSVRRGVNFLLKRQTAEGTWEEKQHTGTGFPRVFYLIYHLYRHYFPLAALGRYRELACRRA